MKQVPENSFGVATAQTVADEPSGTPYEFVFFLLTFAMK